VLDAVLDLLAVILPTALAVLGCFVSIRQPKAEYHKLWFMLLIAMGLCVSGVVFWQQSRARTAQNKAEARSEEDRKTGQEHLLALRDQIEALTMSLTKPPLVVRELARPAPAVHPKLSTPELPLPPAVVGEIRFTERRTDSPKKEFPYALQVIIQTSAVIEHPAFRIECDGEIAEGDFFIAGQPIMMNKGWGADKNVFSLRLGFPPLTPESSMVVTLLSKSPIRVKRLDRVRAS
jgi:hypothetical protein